MKGFLSSGEEGEGGEGVGRGRHRGEGKGKGRGRGSGTAGERCRQIWARGQPGPEMVIL